MKGIFKVLGRKDYTIRVVNTPKGQLMIRDFTGKRQSYGNI